MVKNTGVKVSEEHRQVALQRARGVVSAPVIKVHGKWIPDEERLAFGDWLDGLAQSYGLPEPAKDSDGDALHYGMTNDGEFTKWEGDADACAPQDILGT
jgi:hypothetical protein